MAMSMDFARHAWHARQRQRTTPGGNTNTYLDINELPQKGDCCVVSLAQGLQQLLLRTLPLLAPKQCAYQTGLQLRTLSWLRQIQLHSTAPLSPLLLCC